MEKGLAEKQQYRGSREHSKCGDGVEALKQHVQISGKAKCASRNLFSLRQRAGSRCGRCAKVCGKC